ncbi:MAG: uncharacterized protein KVP18_002049 [Porospora cf. gigantea A]|uniref:uncharacterized protein n=2 Tax=Porospora cf. gigantea A TaxID=2853593 RepID=UPI00355A8118|nr:MAG: hypothetical protein KVP18_002049 [Porospora cf. gigantea A]
MEGNTILSYVEGMETPSLEAIYTLLTDAMRFVDVPGRHAALKLITEGEEDKLALICSVSISSMRSIEVTLPLTLQDAEVAHEVIMRNVVLPSVLGHSVLASCFDTQIETLPIDQRAAIHRSLKTDCRRLPPLQVCSVDGVLELPSSAFLTERNRVSDLSRGVQQALCFRSCPTSPPSDPAGTLVRNVKTVDVVKNSSVVSRNIRKGLRRSKRS